MPEAAAFCQEHWLHGGFPMILVAMVFFSCGFAVAALFNSFKHERDWEEEDAAQMDYLRRYVSLQHRSGNDA